MIVEAVKRKLGEMIAECAENILRMVEEKDDAWVRVGIGKSFPFSNLVIISCNTFRNIPHHLHGSPLECI